MSHELIQHISKEEKKKQEQEQENERYNNHDSSWQSIACPQEIQFDFCSGLFVIFATYFEDIKAFEWRYSNQVHRTLRQALCWRIIHTNIIPQINFNKRKKKKKEKRNSNKNKK